MAVTRTARRPAPRARKPPRRRRWLGALAVLLLLALLAGAGVLAYFYVTFSHLIDARLNDGLERVEPRVFARPFVLRKGQAISQPELIDRLNDLGYAHRPRAEAPGQFAVGEHAVALMARGGERHGQAIRVVFRGPVRRASTTLPPASQIEALEVVGRGAVDSVSVEPPLLTALASATREKRRRVPLAHIPKVAQQAVLAIEDRRFYDHPGVDVIRTIGAIVTNVRGDRPYLVGGSTLTQQLVKNFFLTREKTYKRKLQEQLLAVILERRLTKDEILELYLNEVYLGQRGSFAVHGVAEASRMFFGKDVSNLTLAEAATIAGVIQSPPAYSPFRANERARQRRNVVLGAMAETGYISAEAASRAAALPLEPVARALDAEAPYFVDHIGQTFAEHYPGLATGGGDVDVYTTIDIHLQRLAQDAVREGLATVDQTLARRSTRGRAEAALLAIDPRTGDVLAWVGGRFYNRSQFNRVMHARRQPGSVFKPFVYLAAFERALAMGVADLTPATVVIDEPTTFYSGEEEWNPRNYGDEYDGPVTLRRALALSRNIAAIKVAEAVGYDTVAALWKQVGTSMQPKPYPSIALGVFEVTPFEVAEAYTVFANGGELRPLRTILGLRADGGDVAAPAVPPTRRLASLEATFLVQDMMRSVMDEGTGLGARAAGFRLDAAGKSGTTNDLRDAWFVGFTPELLTVVWVGFDDNQALGLSGSQAALPIWTTFMTRALSGHPNLPFESPETGLTYVEIDRDTGELAGPACPRVLREVFISGTEPLAHCALHRF